MKSLILSLLLGLMVSMSAQAATGLRCSLVNDFDDWSIEIKGDQAAFFDNDSVVYAQYFFTEGTRDFYRNIVTGDEFVLEVNRYRPTLAIQTARLTLLNDIRRIEAFDFLCFDTEDFFFFD
jgi:hypothetical protein